MTLTPPLSSARIIMTSAECLFNTAVPLTIRSGVSNPNNFNNFNGNNFYSAVPSMTHPFFTTNVTPVQFQDDQGKRVNSVVFEIYLHTIVANKKVNRRNYYQIVLEVLFLDPSIENFGYK